MNEKLFWSTQVPFLDLDFKVLFHKIFSASMKRTYHYDEIKKISTDQNKIFLQIFFWRLRRDSQPKSTRGLFPKNWKKYFFSKKEQILNKKTSIKNVQNNFFWVPIPEVGKDKESKSCHFVNIFFRRLLHQTHFISNFFFPRIDFVKKFS